MDENKIAQLQDIVRESKNIVFFGGAGVSTESGIPDFRSQDGLYNQKYKYPPETMLSRTFYDTHTEDFFDFYRDKILHLEAKPNAAHYKLAELEKAGKVKAVITQNIDGLHQLAGSKNVIELHGSVLRNYCQHCGKNYSAEYIQNTTGVPRCDCGGQIKPDVVLYEEALNQQDMENAILAISQADTLIIGGTSLVVYPAAGMVHEFHGKHLVVINKGQTFQDNTADLVINDPIGQVFEQITVW